MTTTKTNVGHHLTINTVKRVLSHFKGDTLIQTYPVAVGKPATPTPPGHYSIVNKIMNPGGVLGTRWMGLNIPGGNYGIHGTNNPASIGTAASLGCIRMHNHNVEQLFSILSIGTPVSIAAGSDSISPTVPHLNPNNTPQQVAPASGTITPSTGGYNSSSVSTTGKNYVVQSGDTLWNIARQNNTSLDALIAANQLTNPDVLYPGQIIVIP